MVERIAAVGAGRMGRGMAIAFAYAGHPVALIDAKPRAPEAFAALKTAAEAEMRGVLTMLADFGMLEAGDVAPMLDRIETRPREGCAAAIAAADVVFEGVPEVMSAKQEAFALISEHVGADAIVASTTSTILSNDLQGFVTGPHRFLNAHWLNPAFLVPLVELSPGDATDPAVTDQLKGLLERIGKVPVVCAASPGYIVPRIQALAMNEATRYGFGFRFAILGLLEFIDWGGGDILFHASRYMSEATGQDRFKARRIIEENMAAGRTGLRDGQGFLDYAALDVPAYQRERLAAFVAMLRHLDKMPPKG